MFVEGSKWLYISAVDTEFSAATAVAFQCSLQIHFEKGRRATGMEVIAVHGLQLYQCVIYASSNLLSISPNKQRLRSYGNRNESVSIRSGWASQPLYKNIPAIFPFLCPKSFSRC